MMNYSFILAVLAAVSSAVPTPQATGTSNAAVSSITPQQVHPNYPTSSGRYGSTTTQPTVAKASITPKQIVALAPGSSSCAAGATTGCSTPDAAAAGLNAAFEKYGHTSLGQQAALVGLMAFESVDFQYNVNVYPGRPGQGTKAMLMFNFILPYASAQPELKSQVLQLSGGSTDPNSIPDATKNQIRQMVLPDQYTFAAASWFLNNECGASVAAQLTTGGLTAFESYITNCVGTTFTPDRQTKWCQAFNALKSAGTASPQGC